MEIALFCGICKQKYNIFDNNPLLLNCNHTFCRKCVALQQNGTFVCPLDGKDTIIENIDDLPKNLSYLKILEGSSGDTVYFTPRKSEKTSLELSNLRKSMGTLKQKVDGDFLFDAKAPFEPVENEICTEHSKPMEFYCLSCRSKVCSYCGFFGLHKGHKIENEENIQKTLVLKGEILIDHFEIITSSYDEYKRQESEKSIAINVQAKKEEHKQNISKFFTKVRKMLDKKESECFAQIDTILSEAEDHIHVKNNIPRNVETLIESWKSKVNDKIEILSFSGTVFDMINLIEGEEGKSVTLLMKEAEKISDIIDRMNEMNSLKLKDDIERTIDVSLSTTLSRTLDNLCKVEKNELSYINDEMMDVNLAKDSSILNR